MKYEELPYIHFLVREGQGLVTVGESDSHGGEFYLPLDKNRLFPHYRFDFSIYLGNGNYKEIEGKSVFCGIGETQLDRVMLIPYEYFSWENREIIKFPRLYRNHETFKYCGKSNHPDLESSFCGTTTDEDVLHKWLDYGISFIGCHQCSQQTIV